MSITSFVLPAMVLSSGIGQEPQADSGANIVGTTIGVDGATLAWSLLYARGIRLAIDRQLVLATTFTLPMSQPDFGDWRWASGLRIDAIRHRGFVVPIAASFVVRKLETLAVSAVGVGSELVTMPGFYGRRWFLAGECSWDQQWATRVRHSDAYREVVYADVKDGWYGVTGFTMRYGARVGGRPWRHMELWVRGGYEQHGVYNQLAPPIYALVGTNFRF